MASTSAKKNGLSVTAYQGDAKTLLAFNLPDRKSAKQLAGFTIQCQPGTQPPYYLFNTLRFKVPGQHTQVATEPAVSSINAPFHKFRWLHIPGFNHQGTKPFMGPYTYTVTPRFFDDNASLQPIDPDRSVSVSIDVVPFQKGRLALGFTRGFTQSQAFVHHFGLKALVRPKDGDLLFDTSVESGINAEGNHYTFLDEYEWMGYTARATIFSLLEEVLADKSLHLDMFAYDLNEPDLIQAVLKLASQKRVRVILDNAALHHSAAKPRPEDEFEQLFQKTASKAAGIKRGHFKRYAHDKIFIVSNGNGPTKVLTGSTNFSVTGLYVNSNHVLVFDDPSIAGKYAQVFEEAWNDNVKGPAFSNSALANGTFTFKGIPKTEITFSPHPTEFATKVLDGIVTRIESEKKTDGGSVLFAVMQMDKGTGPVFPALRDLHADQKIFTFGISDSPGGIYLYKPGSKQGVLVTGKPVNARLPPPFDQVPGIGGVGHQIHHKFIVCGFNGDDPIVYCGSSNLALGGEESNGDNLIVIRDKDVATAFAMEALALVDHFNFLDSAGVGPKKDMPRPKFASNQQLAASAGWFLSTSDKWVDPYFDPNDLHCLDRELFG